MPALSWARPVEIELEAHGEFETTSALHSYFNVGDIAAVKVSGLGERYIDKVNNAEEGVPEQQRADLPRTAPIASISTPTAAA